MNGRRHVAPHSSRSEQTYREGVYELLRTACGKFTLACRFVANARQQRNAVRPAPDAAVIHVLQQRFRLSGRTAIDAVYEGLMIAEAQMLVDFGRRNCTGQLEYIASRFEGMRNALDHDFLAEREILFALDRNLTLANQGKLDGDPV